MIKLYIYCSVLIIGNVEVGPDIGMKFHQEVMEIVSYDTIITKSTMLDFESSSLSTCSPPESVIADYCLYLQAPKRHNCIFVVLLVTRRKLLGHLSLKKKKKKIVPCLEVVSAAIFVGDSPRNSCWPSCNSALGISPFREFLIYA